MTNSVKQIIIQNIKGYNEVAFQRWFWGAIKHKYSDLETPKPKKDKGNDGYSIKGKIFFAVNGVENGIFDGNKVSEKIKSDYKKFVTNWKSKNNFDTWAFVVNGELTGIPHQTFNELNSNGDGINKTCFDVNKLVDFLSQLSNEEKAEILGLPISLFEETPENLGVLGEIFEYIFSNKIQAPDEFTVNSGGEITPIPEKIKINFTEAGAKAISQTFINLVGYNNRVKKYVENEYKNNAGRIWGLIDNIQNTYHKISRKDIFESIDDINIIDKMATQYLPDKMKKNIDYITTSKAIILYFFELCYFGKKKVDDKANSNKVF